MDKSKIDSEFLIATIKRFDSIWNKNSKEYHKKSSKEAAWTQVCEEVYDNWDAFTEDEQIGKLFELKKRWNNIRDYYKKDLSLQLNGSIGQPSMKRKKYVFSNKLDFLRPVLDKSCNREKTSENDDDEQEMEIYLEEAIDSSNSETSYSPKRKNTMNIVEDKKVLEAIPTRTDSSESDYDLLFLKSLLPDMKVMTRRQKVNFKLGILQLYKNIMSEKPDFVEYDENDTKNPLK